MPARNNRRNSTTSSTRAKNQTNATRAQKAMNTLETVAMPEHRYQNEYGTELGPSSTRNTTGNSSRALRNIANRKNTRNGK